MTKSVDVSDAELAVLEVLWKKGQSTIRTITDALYPETSTSYYATVQKLLDRLEKKSIVQRDRSGFAHTFRPLIKRENLIDERLQEVARKLCGGSLTPLLVHLVGAAPLSDKERRLLRELIDRSKLNQEKESAT